MLRKSDFTVLNWKLFKKTSFLMDFLVISIASISETTVSTISKGW